MRILLSAAVLLMLTADPPQAPGDRPAANPRATRSVVLTRNGIIATSQPLASAAGLRVLQQGGNAIDAAVTAILFDRRRGVMMGGSDPRKDGLAIGY